VQQIDVVGGKEVAMSETSGTKSDDDDDEGETAEEDSQQLSTASTTMVVAEEARVSRFGRPCTSATLRSPRKEVAFHATSFLGECNVTEVQGR
jgi:hypothetical protein